MRSILGGPLVLEAIRARVVNWDSTRRGVLARCWLSALLPPLELALDWSLCADKEKLPRQSDAGALDGACYSAGFQITANASSSS